MGWKSFRDHYRIKHFVQITDKGLCIGSGYVHDIIVVGMDGCLIKGYDRTGGDLARYQAEIEADKEQARRLIEAEDTFATSIPVFTYEGGKIIETLCEEPGWPNDWMPQWEWVDGEFITLSPPPIPSSRLPLRQLGGHTPYVWYRP